MTTLVDAEAMILPFVRGVTGSVAVATKVSNPRPDVFVRLWVTGGYALSRIHERVQVTVDVWAPDTVRASALAGEIRQAFLNDYARMPLVRGVEEITRPYSLPDETSDRYRASYALTVRAARS